MQFKCYFGRFYDEILEGEILHVKPFRFMNEMMVSCGPHRLIDSTKLTHTTSQQGLYDMNVCQQATEMQRSFRSEVDMECYPPTKSWIVSSFWQTLKCYTNDFIGGVTIFLAKKLFFLDQI